MSGNELRRYMDIISLGNSKVAKTLLTEDMDEGTQAWYVEATKRMVDRVRAGEYPIDVINEIAREYSWQNEGSYEAFAFARDALDRRAWEMGLRYADDEDGDTPVSDDPMAGDDLDPANMPDPVDDLPMDPMDPVDPMAPGDDLAADPVDELPMAPGDDLAADPVDELPMDPGMGESDFLADGSTLSEEELVELDLTSLPSKMLKGGARLLSPNFYTRLESKKEVKSLTTKLMKSFLRLFGSEEANITVKNAAKHLIGINFHPTFVKSILGMYGGQAGQIQIESLTEATDAEKNVKEFLTVVAVQTIMAGGLANVSKKNYDTYLKDQAAIDDEIDTPEEVEQAKSEIVDTVKSGSLGPAELAKLRDAVSGLLK